MITVNNINIFKDFLMQKYKLSKDDAITSIRCLIAYYFDTAFDLAAVSQSNIIKYFIKWLREFAEEGDEIFDFSKCYYGEKEIIESIYKDIKNILDHKTGNLEDDTFELDNFREELICLYERKSNTFDDYVWHRNQYGLCHWISIRKLIQTFLCNSLPDNDYYKLSNDEFMLLVEIAN